MKAQKALGKDCVPDTGRHKSIHLRLFIVVVAVSLTIAALGLAVGTISLTHSIENAIKSDMLVMVDIADQYVSKEILLLKIEAAEAAGEVKRLYDSGEAPGVLERVLNDFERKYARISDDADEGYMRALEGIDYHKYIGLAVYDETGLIDYAGIPAPSNLHNESFMRAAFEGRQSMSTTMYIPNGGGESNIFVMFVSAPLGNGRVLAAALPGLFFSKLISLFEFWESGHLFIDDIDGYIIVNNRDQWVLERRNFIELNKIESGHEEVAAMVSRGIKGERGTAEFSIDDVPRICAFRPISGSKEGWFLGIIAPISESAIRDIPESILLIGITMLILCVIAAGFAARYLKRPYIEVDRLRRAAEAASVSKSTFLANMSHEIRTPMNSIIGFSELALDSDIPPRGRDYLTKILTNAEWLLQIINDILDVSKIESGKMSLESIPFDMSELFASCRTLTLPKAVEKGITLYFYAEPSFGKKPLGDPTRLRQVFVNLLSNAIKFTNVGMVKLHSVLKGIGDDTITVFFEVKDSGIGMTPEQMKHIFDPFSQAESGTTRKYGGSGLGLTITKNIVELMGGKLSVESTPGVGSKFSFELTFKTIDAVTGTQAETEINELKKPTFKGEILLCEDNVMNQQVMCDHLERVGIKTVVADNGRIGVDMVKNRIRDGKKQFDLIFMDIHMPIMDGFEAASEILKLDADVPIVAVTANIMNNDKENYTMNGMHDCIGKPFTSAELWRCLMKYFQPVQMSPVDEVKHKHESNELRERLIVSFVKDNKNRYAEIAEAIRNGDIKLAHRLAHTLKSNAGNLGKLLLQKVCAAIEDGLADGENLVTPQQMTAFKLELDAVLEEFAPLYAELTGLIPADDAEPLDAQTARETLEQLIPLLEMGSPRVREFTEELRRIPGGKDLLRYIEDFEFDSAIAAAAELKNSLQ